MFFRLFILFINVPENLLQSVIILGIQFHNNDIYNILMEDAEDIA